VRDIITEICITEYFYCYYYYSYGYFVYRLLAFEKANVPTQLRRSATGGVSSSSRRRRTPYTRRTGTHSHSCTQTRTHTCTHTHAHAHKSLVVCSLHGKTRARVRHSATAFVDGACDQTRTSSKCLCNFWRRPVGPRVCVGGGPWEFSYRRSEDAFAKMPTCHDRLPAYQISIIIIKNHNIKY